MEEEKDLMKELKEKVESHIKNIVDNNTEVANVDILYKLVDIHKDIENECYWKIKKEVMNDELQNKTIRWRL